MTPPRHPDIIQAAILGTLIRYPDERNVAAAILQPDDFISGKHRRVYEWMITTPTFDFVTLCHAMTGIIPADELDSWRDEPTSAFLPHYCKELKEASNKVRLYDLTSDVRTMFANNKTYPEIREHIESTLTQMTSGAKQKTLTDSKTLVSETIDRIEQRHEAKGALTGIPYGWSDLDGKTNGMHRGDLIIVAGRPSMGKSAFAGNVFESVTNCGFRGVLFSLEMGRDQVMDRMTASVGRVKYDNIRSGRLEDHEWSRFQSACERLHRQPLLIDDAPNLSLADLRAKCRKLKPEGLDVVIIDYLQLMKLPAKENRVQAIGEISRGLKLLARELDVVMIALSQLSRGVESRQDKRPTMSDLRDSGELEQDADVIIFPFRPAAYCDKCRDRRDDESHNTTKHQMIAEILIEKQRNGERNISIPMVWHGKFQRFDQRQTEGCRS